MWESRASVRTRPRKGIDFLQPGSFFPESKQPLLRADLSLKITPELKEKILLLSFFKYLHEIIYIEIHSVIKACHSLMYDTTLPVDFTEGTKLDACTIIIDEYYHVYIARDLINQLAHKFPDLKLCTDYDDPDAHKAIDKVKARLDKKYHNVFTIIAVSIFETTLVRELVEFFNDVNVNPSIRYYVNDHMNDESRHYNFFYKLLCHTFHTMPEEYKKQIGSVLGDFIFLYLSIDSEKNFSLQILQKYLSDQCNPQEVVSKMYRGFEITQEIPIVKNVMKVLKSSKILENKYVRGSFRKRGWVV